jgi:hypothetical protein
MFFWMFSCGLSSVSLLCILHVRVKLIWKQDRIKPVLNSVGSKSVRHYFPSTTVTVDEGTVDNSPMKWVSVGKKCLCWLTGRQTSGCNVDTAPFSSESNYISEFWSKQWLRHKTAHSGSEQAELQNLCLVVSWLFISYGEWVMDILLVVSLHGSFTHVLTWSAD